MARQSNVFSSVRANPAKRKRIYRQARLGARPRPSQPNIGDAFKTLTATARYVQWFEDNKGTIEFLGVLDESWKDRKDWRP